MEQSVGQGVGLETDDGGRRVAVGGGQHVVPLEDLVQQDPVDEAAEPDAQQQARGHRDRPRPPYAVGRGFSHHAPWDPPRRVRW